MSENKSVRLHLTNIIGLGATQLVESLLPAIERAPGYDIAEEYLPAEGKLAHHVPTQAATLASRYRRRAPNVLSRFLECTLLARKFSGEAPLLVLGDIPLRCRTRQTVFVQTPLLTSDRPPDRRLSMLKYRVSRWVFARNTPLVSAFIVQTAAMKAALIAAYPEIADRVHIIPVPVPAWLLEHAPRRTRRDSGGPLRLFYPAASYPHKNHRLLSDLGSHDASHWPVAELLLTIPRDRNPNLDVPWIVCAGRLNPEAMIMQYERADALLFLSRAESLGFPLLEAMWVGLPIICPDLPYARVLCGDGAIYFSQDSVDSLRLAVRELWRRLGGGWWPDWTKQLEGIPRSWDNMAAAMLDLAANIPDQ